MAKKQETHSIGTLEDAFLKLDSSLKASERNEIKLMTEEEFFTESHFSTGAWIRNNWIRGGKLGFIEEWRSKGLRSMDDYSDIILTSYYRYLTNADIDLEGQFKRYKDYYLLNSLPDKIAFPEEILKMKIKNETSYFYNIDEGLQVNLFILSDEQEDNIWIYNYFYGWKQIDKVKFEEIQKNAPIVSEYVESLFSKN